jgi:serum/glucocorticoid-regulated kinase 2
MNAMVETYGQEVTKGANEKLTIKSFTMMCVIGKGSYAEVILARKKDTGIIYALKILKKKKIEQRNQKDHVRTERNILVRASILCKIKMFRLK